MIETFKSPMKETEIPATKPNGIANILVGLMIGGGATALIDEYRIEEARQRNESLVMRANEVIEHAYPVVTAAALEADLPPPPGANFPQGIPDRFYDSKIAARSHSQSFGNAVEAFRAATQMSGLRERE